jgi:prepilin-type N-terminal cleavage/methylation domain-containing protein
VISPETSLPDGGKPAFSLIEMAAVLAISVILLVAGASLLTGSGRQSRKAGADLLAGMIEQARTAAITTRSHVVLAVAEPGDLADDDGRCRLGLFRVETWPALPTDPVEAVLMGRWRTLETGVILIGGEVDGVANPLDNDELTISCGTARPLTVRAHAIGFNPRGGLHYPPGSGAVTLRLAEGNYREGKATAYQHGGSGVIAENHLKIGRVTARPYHIDG